MTRARSHTAVLSVAAAYVASLYEPLVQPGSENFWLVTQSLNVIDRCALSRIFSVNLRPAHTPAVSFQPTCLRFRKPATIPKATTLDALECAESARVVREGRQTKDTYIYKRQILSNVWG